MSSINARLISVRKRRGSTSESLTPRVPRPAPATVPAPVYQPEETLIRDVRGNQRPAEFVERKLVALLQHAVVPVSQIRCSSCGRGTAHSR